MSQFSQNGGAGHLGHVESGLEGSERYPVQQVSHMGVSDGSWITLDKFGQGSRRACGSSGSSGRWVKWERGSSGPNE
jgi:hypothetical protein